MTFPFPYYTAPDLSVFSGLDSEKMEISASLLLKCDINMHVPVIKIKVVAGFSLRNHFYYSGVKLPCGVFEPMS